MEDEGPISLSLPLTNRAEEETPGSFENRADASGDSPGSDVKETPHEVTTMLTMVGVAQGRCGLLAGFTYYELSRQSTGGVEDFPRYVCLLLTAFSLAVTSTAIGAFLRVYLRRVHFSDWAKYASRMMIVARLSYYLFILAALVWMVALSCMGEVYNAQMEMEGKDIQIGPVRFRARLLTMLPFYVLLPTCGLCVLYVLLVSALAGRQQKLSRQSQCPKTGVFLNDRAQEDMEGAKKAADTTMYLLGFTGASLARYKASTQLCIAGGPNAWEGYLNILFWVLTVFGTAALSLVMICGTHTYTMLVRLHPECREFVHSKIKHLCFALNYIGKLGLVIVSCSAVFIGWGCSGSCVTRGDVTMNMLEETGACYASVAWVPFGIGSVGLLATAFLACRVRSAHRQAEHQYVSEVTALISQGKSGMEWQTHLTDDGSASAALTDNWASQASLFSGFVYYNLACFDSDIIQGPISADFESGVTWANTLFLAVTMVSFAFGMALVNLAAKVQSERQAIGAQAVHFIFAEKIGPVIWTMGVLRRLAMYGFLASFALIGFVKMVPNRPEPAIVTVIGAVYLAKKEKYLTESFEAAKALRGKHKVEDLGDWKDFVGATHRLTYPRIQSQLKVMAPNSLFFGAFCYNGVNFLFRPSAIFAPFYATTLACCFVLSLFLVLTEGSISAKFVQLESNEAKKEFFSRKLVLTLRKFYLDYNHTPVLFMGAIILMGPVKLWRFDKTSSIVCPKTSSIISNATEVIFWPACQQLYTNHAAEQEAYSLSYGWIISLGGLLGMLGSWMFLSYVMEQAFKTSKKVKEMMEEKEKKRVPGLLRRTHAQGELIELDPYDDVKEDSDIRTASVLFQTGNVFYEVLFTVINPGRAFPNYVYLTFSVITLALGCIALVIGSSIAIWMDDFPTKSGKSLFAQQVQPCVSLLFFLYHSSLLSWLVAMMASSAVKYETEGTEPMNGNWRFSFITSLAAIVVICLSWLVILSKQRGLKPANPNLDGIRAGKIGWREFFAPVTAILRALFSVEGGSAVQADLETEVPEVASFMDASEETIS